MHYKKIAAGSKVFLSSPSIDDMPEFLETVSRSHDLHFPWVSPPSNQTEYKNYLEKIEMKSNLSFLIKLNENNKIAGVININEVVKGCFQSGYLGFYIFSGFESQGLMSEGLSLVIDYAFNQLKLHRLEANIQPDNIKSISVIKKQKFQHEGFSPKYLKINGAWKDHERFAITTDD
jgi:[ribosomal protein S5]-alanine N-acetyltransferase